MTGMPNAAAADLSHDLEDFLLVSTRVARSIEVSRTALIEQIDALGVDVRAAIIELAEADRDRREHFTRFPAKYDDEGKYIHDAPGTEGNLDWSRCLRRCEMAVEALVRVGGLIRDAAQLPLPTPKPVAIQPESRL